MACFNLVNKIQKKSQGHRKKKETYMLMKAFTYMLLNISFTYFFIPANPGNRGKISKEIRTKAK